MADRAPTRRPRAGGVTLELILSLAILLVMSLAVVEFAILFAALRHVEFTSRVGAKVAAELTTAQLASPASADTVKDAVDRALATFNRQSCQVIVEHNAPCNGLQSQTHVSTATCPGCTPLADPLPTTTLVQSGTVRVTVCIDADQLAPDLLSFLGFSINGRIVSVSTTYPFENCTAGPLVIPIANASFEDPGVGAAGPVPDWTVSTTLGTGTAEVYNPLTADFAVIPDGIQVARLTPDPTATAAGSVTLSQTLTTPVENGAGYRLRVFAGESGTTNPPREFTVRLRAGPGGTVFGTTTVAAGTIANGTFEPIVLVATGAGAPANIVVELVVTTDAGTEDGVGYFDDVRLLQE